MTMQELTDDELLARYDSAGAAAEEARHYQGLLEMEIQRRMRERNSVGIPSAVFVCEMRQTNTYDQSRFMALKELILPDELAAVFMAEHEELVTVNEKWNTVKLLAVARRYGGEVLRLVEESKIPGTPRLLFKRK